jgi:hypothetical protein
MLLKIRWGPLAANCGLARKARYVRARAASCREQDRCLSAPSSHRTRREAEEEWADNSWFAGAAAAEGRRRLNSTRNSLPTLVEIARRGSLEGIEAFECDRPWLAPTDAVVRAEEGTYGCR